MIYFNMVCWVVAILSLVYAIFHPYMFGEFLKWYWDNSKKLFLIVWDWLKGFNK